LGYAVIEADRPSVALAIAAAGTTAFDVVLTDLLMPEMDGRAMAAGLREARPDLPVVFMSGYSPESIFADGVLPDGVPFLAKPFSVEVLAARLRTALDASRDAAGPGDAQGRA
jgi:CheY-like chemotaxis protein